MSFNVGLLEMIGYLVPGATVIGAWLWLSGELPLDQAGKLGGTAGLGLVLLASYVLGQLLTIVSSVIKVGPPHNPYRERQPFKARFEAMFGEGLPDRASYHLSRALVVHQSSALGERIERYFALIILTRNLTVACVVVTALLVRSAHLGWAAAWAGAAAAFFFQHRRFGQTEGKAVFGATVVVLATGRVPDTPPAGRTTEADVTAQT
jgi:hypothetical protein